MAIVADITTLLLSMIGLESVSDGPASVEQEIIACLQEAQALLADSNPSFFYKIRDGEAAAIRAPKTITIAVTQYGKTATVTGWEAWMSGCTVLIDGDDNYNRLLNPFVADTARSLQRPYMGTSGSKSATVWNDWSILASNVRSICQPVMLNQYIILGRATSLASITGRRVGSRLPVTGVPKEWFALAHPHLGKERAGILLDNLPVSEFLLSYDARIAFDPITALNDSRAEIIPGDGRDKSMFLPVVRYLFSSQPGCSTPKQELQDGFQRATTAALALRVDGSRQKRFNYTPR